MYVQVQVRDENHHCQSILTRALHATSSASLKAACNKHKPPVSITYVAPVPRPNDEHDLVKIAPVVDLSALP